MPGCCLIDIYITSAFIHSVFSLRPSMFFIPINRQLDFYLTNQTIYFTLSCFGHFVYTAINLILNKSEMIY